VKYCFLHATERSKYNDQNNSVNAIHAEISIDRIRRSPKDQSQSLEYTRLITFSICRWYWPSLESFLAH